MTIATLPAMNASSRDNRAVGVEQLRIFSKRWIGLRVTTAANQVNSAVFT